MLFLKNDSGKSSKVPMKKPGSGRVNEVGDDVSIPIRVPKSLHESVKALVKLQRGKKTCPQIYAAVAMYSIYEVFDEKLDSLPIWSPESYKIKKYMQSIVNALIELADKPERPDDIEQTIQKYEELQDKVEYSYSEVSLYRTLKENLEFIESVENTLKKFRIKIR